ncbi:hypothetical protein ANCCAN_18401 [Ancylostoma caninum]|uniref:Uncharacterized protein n=1 Tax=Ancylostoma caninum TaxID=29170 RepID=A0A368FY60_ANCCA|nr:hypothetical protein ANCCAN_18401 [Ancylostoma caninum]
MISAASSTDARMQMLTRRLSQRHLWQVY